MSYLAQSDGLGCGRMGTHWRPGLEAESAETEVESLFFLIRQSRDRCWSHQGTMSLILRNSTPK